MDVKSVAAIDSHTHINHNAVYDNKEDEGYSAQLHDLFKINNVANIKKMLCSTFASVLSTEIIVEENEYMFELCAEFENLYQWVVVDPRIDETFRQADRMLHSRKCVGIKLHPLYHKYSLKEYADKLFDFAEKYRSIVLIHPDESPVQYVDIANKYPNVKFVMAHLGDAGYVDAIERAEYQNIYTDTSGIASSRNNIIEYAVSRVGSEHILFGTDTYAAGFQRGRIEYALISERDKENILFNNAVKIFGDVIK